MKANLISKRAQTFLENPEFYKADLAANFAVTFDAHDKILTAFHNYKATEVATVLADVVSRFAKNKKISELWKINFREVDSFLRDSNHLPTFPEDQQLVEELLLKTKVSLIAHAVSARLGDDLIELKNQFSQWGELSLVTKNLWAQKIISPLEWQLVLCESDSLILTNMAEGVSSAEFSILFQEILGGQEVLLPMKIVAV